MTREEINERSTRMVIRDARYFRLDDVGDTWSNMSGFPRGRTEYR